MIIARQSPPIGLVATHRRWANARRMRHIRGLSQPVAENHLTQLVAEPPKR